MPNDINALRDALFETIRGLRDGTVTLDQARAINEVSKTVVDTAKVEVDFLRVTGGEESTFIAPGHDDESLPEGITGRKVHRLR